jgi:hypothetical protein
MVGAVYGLILFIDIALNRRPTSLHDRSRDSDDDDYHDRDYDVAALANNLSQAFRYGIYSNDDMDEVMFSCFLFIAATCDFSLEISIIQDFGRIFQ